MNIVNEQVTHKYFGTGSVAQQTENYVEICFQSGNKKFVFPDAFGAHLMLIDQRVSEAVKKIKQKRETENKQAELESEKERNLQSFERQRQLKQELFVKNFKIHPSSQIAFWCDEEEQKEVFKDWKIFTGKTKNGENKDKPTRPARINQNSACLLTARDAGQPEECRYIVGVFMASEDFTGKSCEDGYIPAHANYKIHLSKQESGKMLFWNYYAKEKYPQNMVWNGGNSRYFDNVVMAQILKDILALKQEKQEKEFMQSFLEYFCTMNRIRKNEIKKPKGALQNIQIT